MATIRNHYRGYAKKNKPHIVDEFIAVSGYHGRTAAVVVIRDSADFI